METRETVLKKAFTHLVSVGKIKKKKDIAMAMPGKRPETVSRAMSGNENYATDQFMIEFDKAFPGIFNLSWLLTGEGDMLLEQPKQEQTSDNAIIAQLIGMMDRRMEKMENMIEALNSKVQKLERAQYGYASVAADDGGVKTNSGI